VNPHSPHHLNDFLFIEVWVFLGKLDGFLSPPSFKEEIWIHFQLLSNTSNDGLATVLGFPPCLEGSGQVIPKEA